MDQNVDVLYVVVEYDQLIKYVDVLQVLVEYDQWICMLMCYVCWWNMISGSVC